MRIPSKLRKSAEEFNESIRDIFERYGVKAKIKQKVINLNSAKLSVVLKTEDNKYLGVLYSLSFDGKNTELKFNTNAFVKNDVVQCSTLNCWICTKSTLICALCKPLINNKEFKYQADYTIRELLIKTGYQYENNDKNN